MKNPVTLTMLNSVKCGGIRNNYSFPRFHSLLTLPMQGCAGISSFSKQLQLQFRCCVNVKQPIQSQRDYSHVLKNYVRAQKFVGLWLYYHIMLVLVESSSDAVAADEAKLCFCVHERFCWVCDLKPSY